MWCNNLGIGALLAAVLFTYTRFREFCAIPGIRESHPGGMCLVYEFSDLVDHIHDTACLIPLLVAIHQVDITCVATTFSC